MASPFSFFSKNQRAWMAAAVFIAIVSFVIAPAINSLSDAARNNSAGSNPVLASWNGGAIRRKQLVQEFHEVQLANRFLRKLAIQVREKGGEPKVPEFTSNLVSLGITTDRGGEEQIIERKLLVEEAKRQGIVFDDDSVKLFLKQFVDGKLDGKQIEKTFRETTRDSQVGDMSWFSFNRLMREELAKNAVLRLSWASVRSINYRGAQRVGGANIAPPSKNWQDFLRFNQAVKIQAFPVFAKDFESQVAGKPSEKEVQELYQQGKDVVRSSRTIATQPAFLKPKTANFEYLGLDFEKVMKEQMALISEDAIRAEYEKRVAEKQFRVPVTPEPAAKDLPEAVGTPTTPTPSPEPPKPSTETSPVDKPVEPTAAPRPPVLEDPKPNALRPANRSDVRLVSYQQEEKTAPKPQEPAPGLEISEPKPSTTTDATQEATATPAGSTPTADGSVAESTPMRTKTLEEVKDQITRELATGPAMKVVDERIERIMSVMTIYQQEWGNYQAMVAAKDKTAKEPTRPNLKELGAPLGFEHATTGMIDAETAQLTPIGTSFIMTGRQQPIPFAALVNASEGLASIFNPNISMGFMSGNTRYVSWKIEESTLIAPPLDNSVREQVVEVWKKQQAFKLAEARAREISSKVGTGSLTDAFTSESEKALVLEPATFTWFNPMFARMESRMQLSNVELLQPVDNDFMEVVFSATPGSSTVAPDMNKTIFYVVKVVEFSPDLEGLQNRFAAAPLEGVANIVRMEADQNNAAWFNNLQKQLGYRAD